LIFKDSSFLSPMTTNRIKRLRKIFSGYIIQEEEDVNNFNSIYRQNTIIFSNIPVARPY